MRISPPIALKVVAAAAFPPAAIVRGSMSVPISVLMAYRVMML